MRLPGDVHLGYCTNVHPADSAAEVEASLRRVAVRVRERLGAERLGLGLYLSRRAAAETDPGALRAVLDSLGLYAFTLNGFPYGDFHAVSVKEAVYRPDWTDPRRAEHTLRLAELIERLAPADVAVPTISTVPLGARRGWSDEADAAAARALVAVARELRARAERGGRPIMVCLEPEPGCAIETIPEAVRFFAGPLAAAAGPEWESLRLHLGLCYDACHQAVMFEDPAEAMAMLAAAGVTVGKAQLASALELRDPGDAEARGRLARFDEPRYLHQARACGGGAAPDLLEGIEALPRDEPWRVHFHLPIDRGAAGALGTTQGELERAIAVLRGAGATRQYEVETYTWSVMPGAEGAVDDDALAAGLAAELAWAGSRLA
jgi:sugar phosphate isomerase/epimerase